MGKKTDLDPTSPNACCEMEGVECEGSDDLGSVVVKISWGNQGLEGPIPPEIGNLRNLQYL